MCLNIKDKNNTFELQVFPVADPQLPSAADFVDLCTTHHHHLPLWRILRHSLEAPSHINLFHCSTKAKH